MELVHKIFKSNFAKFALIITIVGVSLYLVVKFTRVHEKMADLASYMPTTGESDSADVSQEHAADPSVQASDYWQSGAPVQSEMMQNNGDLSPEDLLPKNPAAQSFSDSHATGEGDLSGKNFLTAGFNVGINSVGSSLRNANQQIRSEPANPMIQVSPWQQSTIGPDSALRKPLEIGGDA